MSETKCDFPEYSEVKDFWKNSVDYRDNAKYTIYIHINKINGKTYVGQTCQKPEHRWGENGKKYKDSPVFWNAICKYGWDNFDHVIIAENLTHDEANDMEYSLIKVLHSLSDENGYNISEGGSHTKPLKDDLTGKIFGKWTVIKRDTKHKGHVKWICQCQCGTIASVYSEDLKDAKSHTGCINCMDRTTHGDSKSSPLYNIWCSLRGRHKKSEIQLCDKWNEYISFREWAYNNGYENGKCIYCNGIFYAPDTCQWITKKYLARKDSKIYTYNGQSKNLFEWADYYNIDHHVLYYRIWNGMTIEEALNIPKGCGLNTKLYTYNGETHTLAEWSKISGIRQNTLHYRINQRHMTIEEALTATPFKRIINNNDA